MINKDALRKTKQSEVSAAGDVSLELAEVKKLQKKRQVDAIYTITIDCGYFLTLICC